MFPAHQQHGTIERVLRHHLSQPGSAVADAAGWDSGNVSRFLSNQQGVTISKIDAVVNAAGFVLVSRRYLEAIGTLSEVGANCHCARAGGGECGSSRNPVGPQEMRFQRGHA
ncbi:DNA-binding protein [Paracidovorax wautersii]|uniref:DNA-binding protein n=1 Tax=Paracidovorax wautersii TaxID=1177982 RepID=UPI0031E3576B